MSGLLLKMRSDVMENLTNYDLSTLRAALNGLIATRDESIKHWLERDDADMLLACMKEQKRAQRLLQMVIKAEDDFYEYEDGA
jgi:hypothetical protein